MPPESENNRQLDHPDAHRISAVNPKRLDFCLAEVTGGQLDGKDILCMQIHSLPEDEEQIPPIYIFFGKESLMLIGKAVMEYLYKQASIGEESILESELDPDDMKPED